MADKPYVPPRHRPFKVDSQSTNTDKYYRGSQRSVINNNNNSPFRRGRAGQPVTVPTAKMVFSNQDLNTDKYYRTNYRQPKSKPGVKTAVNATGDVITLSRAVNLRLAVASVVAALNDGTTDPVPVQVTAELYQSLNVQLDLAAARGEITAERRRDVRIGELKVKISDVEADKGLPPVDPDAVPFAVVAEEAELTEEQMRRIIEDGDTEEDEVPVETGQAEPETVSGAEEAPVDMTDEELEKLTAPDPEVDSD